MRPLSERQIDRVLRKAENSLACNEPFDPSRTGVGKIDKRYLKDERDAINAATDAKITNVALSLGFVLNP